MSMNKMIAVLALTLGLAATPVLAADVEIRMLNKGESGSMVFEPAFVRIAPGDTVNFVATNKSHNAETISDMLPAGAEPFEGGLNKDVSVTFTVEGVYGIKCAPHLGMGMIALVVVGDGPVDVEALRAVKLPKKAKERFEAIFAEL
jgi:pseudoazurin